MTRVHDYAHKLQHHTVLDGAVAAVQPTVDRAPGSLADLFRSRLSHVAAPVSINLDLTVACNYACDHCIDLPLLNTGERHTVPALLRALTVLRLGGLRSVILIGGGEPTLHPAFGELVVAIKALGLQCAVVSNGSNNRRIAAVSSWLSPGDWVRLSLDAGTDETFQAMHRPRKRLSLHSICEEAATIKRNNRGVALGFSFIVSWPGAAVCGRPIGDNVDEMALAAQLARDHEFDFIAFKPLLDRDEGGAEVVDFGTADDRHALAERVGAQLDAARALQTDRFRVLESVNLRALGAQSDPRQRVQPRRCHMRLFRQVLTPTGLYGCPVYRGADHDRMAPSNAYESVASFLSVRRRTLDMVDSFDASKECSNVTCIYNATNWWLQNVRDGQEPPPPWATDAAADFFL